MEVEQIRPNDLVERQQFYIDQDVAWLLSNTDKFVEVVCPCCGSNKITESFIKNRFFYKSCLDCSTSYMSPRPSEKLLSEFYSKSLNYKFWANEMFPQTEKNRIHIFEKRVKIAENLLQSFHPLSKSLLEIGPGYGTFCRIFSERNKKFSIKAVEPSHELAIVCRETGIDTVETTIEKFSRNTSEKFDVVVSFEVIEHLFDPLAMLTSIYDILSPNGLVIFSCPNGLGFDVQVLKEKSETIDHEHLNYFNPKSVSKLLKRAGFDLLTIETPGELDISIVRSVWEKGTNIFQNNEFLELYFSSQPRNMDTHFQEFLKNANLSSNMFVVAIKR